MEPPITDSRRYGYNLYNGRVLGKDRYSYTKSVLLPSEVRTLSIQRTCAWQGSLFPYKECIFTLQNTDIAIGQTSELRTVEPLITDSSNSRHFHRTDRPAPQSQKINSWKSKGVACETMLDSGQMAKQIPFNFSVLL